MRTTIDAAGRVVIPKDLREAARLEPGTPLEVTLHDGRIEIEACPLPVRMRRKGRFLVAEPEAPVPPLTAKTVETTLDAQRRRRGAR